MESDMLWDKFTKQGKVSDYLEYKKSVNNAFDINKTELESVDRNKCSGFSDKRTGGW